MRGIVLFILIVLGAQGFAQSSRYGKNLYNYERRKWHAGTHFGITWSTYNYKLKSNLNPEDSLHGIDIIGQPGFSLNIPMVSYSPVYNFRIRSVVSLSFHETLFNYSYWNKGQLKERSTRVDPVRLNFPLQVKLNTNRMNNFGAYAIAGVAYSVDLQSRKNVTPSHIDPIIRLKKHDYSFEVGGGFDFFLEYFKFGIEVKMQNGLRNVLIADDTFYASPLESLKPRVWWIHLTFEN